MKFLVDAQLPRRLARWLQGRGHAVLHTEQLEHGNRTRDTLLLKRANLEELVLVSKDSDFQVAQMLGLGPPTTIG